MPNDKGLSTAKLELLHRELSRKGLNPQSRADSIPALSHERSRLSLAQRRLWVLDRLQPGIAAYNIPAAFEIRGSLNVQSLRSAYRAVLQRHRVLTACIETDASGDGFQTTRDAAQFDLPLIDLSQIEESARQEHILTYIREHASQSFDLTIDLLIRAHLLRLTDTWHVLVLTTHHIVSDAWSTGILMRDLAALYDAAVHHTTPSLSDLSIQYSDFAEWQRTQQTDTLRRQLDYWQQQLSGALPLLDLPIDRPRRTVQTFRGNTESFVVGPEATKALHALARTHGATLFMVLLGIFKVLLHRYTGGRDILVGTPVAGRSRTQLESLIGLFVNTLVLRSSVDSRSGFDTLLKQIKRTTLDAFSNQDVPFEQLLETLHPERIANRTPLFQVMFSLQNVPQQGISVAGLELSHLPSNTGTAKFDLSLHMLESNASVLGSLEYNSDLFDATTIASMRKHFEVLLRAVCETPTAPLARLPLLTDDEQKQRKSNWQGLKKPVPTKCVHELLRAQANRTPHATAIRSAESALSFGELLSNIEQLATYLRAQGVGPESRIGILFERSPDMVIALWAVLEAGGAYVPLDIASPVKRLEFQIEDADITLVLSHRTLRERRPELPVRVIDTDDLAPIASTQARTATRARVDMQNLAYILYTSGSTGVPKGVQITHLGLGNYIENWCLTTYNLEQGDGAPVHSSLTFDLTVTSLLAPMVVGRAVTLLPAQDEVEHLATQLEGSSDFSLVKLTPAHLSLLDQRLAAGQSVSARAFVVGGEALSSKLAAAWKSRSPRTRIFNEYGPTETVVGCSVHEVDDMETEGSVPIGRPITNCNIYILNLDLQMVPAGIPGEICIAGMGVARGYVGKPALTAERFLPDPFSDVPGERMYRSGDAGSHAADGVLKFIKRIDEQVKVRGYRIEPGEIEQVLRSHPQIKDAVVCAIADEATNSMLVAFLITEQPPPPQELRAHLAQWVPHYMIPHLFTVVQSFPLTANGKVDRQALASTKAVPLRGAEYIAPSNEMQRLVAGIWTDVLSVQKIGKHDNFFDLGGHSIKAMQVAFRIRQLLGIDIPVGMLFEAATIEQLAERLSNRGADSADLPLSRVDRTRPLALSFAQQRMWFLNRLAPDDPAYNIAHTLRMRGELDIPILQRCFQEILSRHEILRTSYAMSDGQPIQVIHASVQLPLQVLDFRGNRDPQLAAVEALRAEIHRPFDISSPASTCRALLCRIADTEYLSTFIIHHIACDARSVELLIRELIVFYDAFSQGRPSTLQPLTFQYADFAAWQRATLTDAKAARQLEYWRSELGEHPPVLELPGDRPRRRKTSAGGIHKATFPSRIRHGVHRAAAENGVTAFMLTLAAFQVLLKRYSNNDSFAIGVPVTERAHPSLDTAIGMFLNMLPVPAKLEGNPTCVELLARVRRSVLSALDNQDLPFERLVDGFAVDRNALHHPIFQTSFTFQHVMPQAFALPGLDITHFDFPADTSRFELIVAILDTGEELTARVEYDSEIFNASTIARMTDHLCQLLAGMCANPSERIDDIALLTPVELKQIAYEWNRTERQWDFDGCIHELVERNADRTQHAVAVEFPDSVLTYGELNSLANKVARGLRNRGIGPDSIVGICVDRSPEMFIGILGTLKSGGAYLPLDPAYPEDRLAYMLHDSRAPITLTLKRHEHRLPSGAGTLLSLDSDWSALFETESDSPLGLESLPDSLAYVIYTSGSTGRPKGTMITHRSLVNHCLSMIETYELDRDSRFSQMISLSFDGSVEDIFPSLAVGARVLCHTGDSQSSLLDVFAFYSQRAVSALHLPTALWHYYAAELRAGKIDVPASVRITSAGGEAIALDTLRDYFAATGNRAKFLNVYGPTEATVTASTYKVGVDQLDFQAAGIPIGHALPNVTLHVVDRRLRLVPIGVPGELYIGGQGVARGYLNRSSLTAERFVPDPFGPSGARMYKTGDVVKRRNDGALEYLGRTDQQVKIRSLRIELAEIESVIATHSGIAQVVVDARNAPGEEKRIVAYYVATGSPPSVDDLRQHVERLLPIFMVPAAFVSIAMIPLTPNGKIDRARLPAPDFSQRGDEFVAPRTPSESLIATIWSQLLQHPNVGVTSNFFEIGGHSLLAVRMHEQLEAEFSKQIPLLALFEHSTIEKLAQYLTADQPTTEPVHDVEAWAQDRRRALKGRRSTVNSSDDDTIGSTLQ